MTTEQGIRGILPQKNALGSRAPSRGSDTNGVVETPGTKRGLKSLHAQLIALGGTIGTGMRIDKGSLLWP